MTLSEAQVVEVLVRRGWGDDDGPGGDWGDCAFADCDDATRAEYRKQAADLHAADLADEHERRFRTQRVGVGDLTVEEVFSDNDIAGMIGARGGR
jgi:hypothetical protein